MSSRGASTDQAFMFMNEAAIIAKNSVDCRYFAG